MDVKDHKENYGHCRYYQDHGGRGHEDGGCDHGHGGHGRPPTLPFIMGGYLVDHHISYIAIIVLYKCI